MKDNINLILIFLITITILYYIFFDNNPDISLVEGFTDPPNDSFNCSVENYNNHYVQLSFYGDNTDIEGTIYYTDNNGNPTEIDIDSNQYCIDSRLEFNKKYKNSSLYINKNNKSPICEWNWSEKNKKVTGLKINPNENNPCLLKKAKYKHDISVKKKSYS